MSKGETMGKVTKDNKTMNNKLSLNERLYIFMHKSLLLPIIVSIILALISLIVILTDFIFQQLI